MRRYIKKINELIDYTVRSKVDLKGIAKKVASKLGYSRIRYMASGSYGDAWKVTSLNDTKVLKLTTDREEAKLAEKLRKRNFKHLVNYYDVRRVRSKNFKSFEVFSIIMEYVTPLTTHKDCELINAIIVFVDRNDFIYNYNNIVQNLNEYGYTIDRKTKGYIKQIKAIMDEFGRLTGGKSAKIDLHYGNVGYRKDGTLVYFDISIFDYDWLKLKNIEV